MCRAEYLHGFERGVEDLVPCKRNCVMREIIIMMRNHMTEKNSYERSLGKRSHHESTGNVSASCRRIPTNEAECMNDMEWEEKNHHIKMTAPLKK